MLESFRASGRPISQALIATITTYPLTVVGTLPILFFRSAPRCLMEAMRGFAGAVMVAASCWPLLAIASRGLHRAAAVLLAGGAMLNVVVEKLIPETTRSGVVDVATLGFFVGFTVMMSLDNVLG